jgi:HEAT repeat protein
MTAALALGQMGDSAKEAVPALIEVLPTDEVVQVLRNTSTALGQIGPAAQGALPALQEVRKKIRVQYSADEAILKIEGRPVPVWH